MRAVVFDLDGTLIDSAPDIAAVLNRVLAAQGLAPLPLAEVRGMIGDGARALLERGYAARGMAFEQRFLDAFIEDYQDNPVRETICYPGIAETLPVLQAQGRQLGVCTNKPIGPTRRILEALGIAGHFAAITGGDSTPYRKPDPRHLAATLAEMEVSEAVMIGDHDNDFAAAEGLKIPAIFVNWGYGMVAAAHVAGTAQELLARIAELG